MGCLVVEICPFLDRQSLSRDSRLTPSLINWREAILRQGRMSVDNGGQPGLCLAVKGSGVRIPSAPLLKVKRQPRYQAIRQRDRRQLRAVSRLRVAPLPLVTAHLRCFGAIIFSVAVGSPPFVQIGENPDLQTALPMVCCDPCDHLSPTPGSWQQKHPPRGTG